MNHSTQSQLKGMLEEINKQREHSDKMARIEKELQSVKDKQRAAQQQIKQLRASSYNLVLTNPTKETHVADLQQNAQGYYLKNWKYLKISLACLAAFFHILFMLLATFEFEYIGLWTLSFIGLGTLCSALILLILSNQVKKISGPETQPDSDIIYFWYFWVILVLISGVGIYSFLSDDISPVWIILPIILSGIVSLPTTIICKKRLRSRTQRYYDERIEEAVTSDENIRITNALNLEKVLERVRRTQDQKIHKLEEEIQGYAQTIESLEASMDASAAEYARHRRALQEYNLLPPEACTEYIVSFLYNAMQNGKATTLEEALELYDQEQQKNELRFAMGLLELERKHEEHKLKRLQEERRQQQLDNLRAVEALLGDPID